MAPSWAEERYPESPRPWFEEIAREDEDARRAARLVGERRWPGFEFIDVHEHFEGRFVGYYLGVPFDWSLSSPELIWGPEEGLRHGDGSAASRTLWNHDPTRTLPYHAVVAEDGTIYWREGVNGAQGI